MIRINVTPDSAVIDIENGMPHVISEVTNLRMQDMREKRHESKKAGDRRKDPAGVE